MVTVSDAIDALKPEHARALMKAHACYPKSEGTGQPLEEYLIMLRDDPVAWLHNLPESWKKKKALDTAKASITAMIKCEKLTVAHSALLKDVVCAFREKLTPDVVQAEIDSRATGFDDMLDAASVESGDASLNYSGTPPEERPVYQQIIPVLMKLDAMYTSLAGQLQDIRDRLDALGGVSTPPLTP